MAKQTPTAVVKSISNQKIKKWQKRSADYCNTRV